MDHGGIGSGSMMGMMEQEETDHDAMMGMLSEGGMDSAAMMEMLREHSMDHEAMMGMMDMHSMDDGDMMDMMSEGDVDHAAMMEMMAQGEFDRDAMMDMMHKHGMDHDAMMGMMAALNTAVQEEEETAMDHDQPGDPALPFDAHFIDGMIGITGAGGHAQLALARAEMKTAHDGAASRAQQAES